MPYNSDTKIRLPNVSRATAMGSNRNVSQATAMRQERFEQLRNAHYTCFTLDIFNSIGFIYTYVFKFLSYFLHKRYQGSFWRILSAKWRKKLVTSSAGKLSSTEVWDVFIFRGLDPKLYILSHSDSLF